MTNEGFHSTELRKLAGMEHFSLDYARAAMRSSADEIERLRGEAEVADEQLAQLRGFAEAHKTCRGSDEPGAPLAGCRNWKPKHGVGPYCGNCGFHENEHADLHR